MAEPKWWETAVFYQIYPRSFADGNGDGIGDLRGMIERLDYLQSLGVDAIWLSPHYPSPQWDCGYDVADYVGVDPEYGTLEDFKEFLDGLHRRGMHLILDLVMNHTSDEHPWFVESRSSRDNPKRDWYVWRDGRDGAPPNDWNSSFGGSAWELDPATGQYYYHMFFKQQPDLNWRNPEVRQAMWDAVRFWLKLGVDGFRIDAIDTLLEHPDWPDHNMPYTLGDMAVRREQARTVDEIREVEKMWEGLFGHQHNQPGIHAIVRELRQVINEFDDRVLVGETDDLRFCGDGSDELHMVFNFPLMNESKLNARVIRHNQRRRLAAIPAGAYPCNTFNNHDSTRVKTHFADGKNDDAIARAALALLLTLKGTPFLYNGEEIGMIDTALSAYNQIRDVIGQFIYQMSREFLGKTEDEALASALGMSRDRCRTPMQWSNQANAGFSPQGVAPWLPVNPNHASGVNVADQEHDAASMLNYYRSMIALRRQTPALVLGDYTELRNPGSQVLAFRRSCQPDGQSVVVMINLSPRHNQVRLAEHIGGLRPLYTSHAGRTLEDLNELRMSPYEVIIAEIV